MTGSTAGFDNALRRGYEYWTERFFLTNGWPKYYPDRLYPVDIHSAAAAIVALVELRGRIPGTLILAEQIANWTIDNLRDRSGFSIISGADSSRCEFPTCAGRKPG